MKYEIDQWVWYIRFPDAVSEGLKRPLRAVILQCCDDGEYIIFVDDPIIGDKWKRRKVNEENLKSMN